MVDIILKPGREKSVLRFHPWIFSGAVERIIGEAKLGQPVNVISSHGDFLARAAINPNSNIIGRIWSWDQNEVINRDFLGRRLAASFQSRKKFEDIINSNAMRLVHGESDGLPGLIIDRYNDTLVFQFLAAGVEYFKHDIIDISMQLFAAQTVYERSDMDVRALEGLPLQSGLLHGEHPDDHISINENDVKFYVDINNGHKTGFYLDQRDNRALLRNIVDGLTVLDCFAYTGGFAINAIKGGAMHVTLVDSSGDALSIANRNFQLNKISSEMANIVESDVFKYLRYLRDSDAAFDMIILDPPKFAPTASQADRAARGYKDINLLALKILKPGGILLSFSCSGGVSEEFFQRIIAGAALDAGVNAVILKNLHQSADHPVALNFPEGKYLKGFLIEKRQ